MMPLCVLISFPAGQRQRRQLVCLKLFEKIQVFLLTQERGQGWWRNLRRSQGETSQNSITTRRGVFQAGSTHVLRACTTVSPSATGRLSESHPEVPIEFGANVRGCLGAHTATTRREKLGFGVVCPTEASPGTCQFRKIVCRLLMPKKCRSEEFVDAVDSVTI